MPNRPTTNLATANRSRSALYSKAKLTWICIAHHRKHSMMRQHCRGLISV